MNLYDLWTILESSLLTGIAFEAGDLGSHVDNETIPGDHARVDSIIAREVRRAERGQRWEIFEGDEAWIAPSVALV
jgi:hypothetical protein